MIRKSHYPLVLRHLKKLENERLVYLKEEKPSKHGKKSKIYTLSFLGLVQLLTVEDLYEQFDTLAAQELTIF